MKDRLLSLTHNLLDCPTAPFREHAVQTHIKNFCNAHTLPFHQDQMGNIIVAFGNAFPATGLAFEAHMDHPGFIIEKDSRGGKTTALFYGGVEEKYFAGSTVRVFSAAGSVTGKILKTSFHVKQHVKRVWLELTGPVQRGDTGMWNLPACRVKGDKLFSRACDDQVGCVAILGLLNELRRRRIRKQVTAIFTVAEEGGLHGAKHLCLKKKLPKRLNIISVETSKTSAYAPIGGGAVIRVGDSGRIFDDGLTRFMAYAARKAAKRNKNFKWQRKLMDGGTCESSIYQAFGYRTGALCIPLGNYHNRDEKKTRIAAEFVSVSDLVNMVDLFIEMIRQSDALPEYLNAKTPEYIEECRELGERLYF